MSSLRWERLEPEQQRILQEAADEARDAQRVEMNEQTAELYERFLTELDVTHPEKDAFRKVTRPVYDEWETLYPDFFQTITEAADKTRAEFQGGQQ